MLFKETEISGVFIIEPQLFKDNRGYFFESFNQRKFNEGIGKEINFVQDNQSKSHYGVLRGLHFQSAPYEQSKLVKVLKGEVLDVAVDLRKDSSTYGKHISIILNEENNYQLFVPKGFAHGFLVLSPTADFFYKCDNFYAPSYDSGIIYNDPDLNIDWKIPKEEIIISEKDKNLGMFKNL
jgi:dTDP-4-dehydrorhamnose 3,5-epimerase